MITRVYIAARYGRRQEMVGVDAALRAAGLEPTSRWVHGGEELVGMTEQAAALMDVDDVRCAQAILFFAEPKGSLNPGGGRHFELGMAYERSMVTVVVGELEQVFLSLPEMKVFGKLDYAIAYLSHAKSHYGEFYLA